MSKPSFINVSMGRVISDIGSPINLTCITEGYPTPTHRWYKDGVLISGEVQPFMYIAEVLPYHRGNYSCMAMNSEGLVESGPIQLAIASMHTIHTSVSSSCKALSFQTLFSILQAWNAIIP